MTREPRRAAFVFIFVTIVLDMLALGMIMPVLPKLVETMAGGDTGRGARIYGMFGTAWALMQFFCSPLMGALSDRFGRRPVVLLSNFGLGLDYLLMAIAPSLPWLFAGRVISGITSASWTTAGAYITDVTPPEQRAGAFGRLSAAFGIGFVLGPAFGGLLGSVDPRLPFWVAGGLSLANAVYGVFVLPESLAPENRSAFSWARANPVGSLRLLRSHPELLGLAGVHFLNRLAHDVLPSTTVLYTSHRYGWDQASIGAMMACVGIGSIVVSGMLAQPIVARFGERRVLCGALAIGTLGMLVHGLAPTGSLFLVGVPMISIWGLSGPSMQGLMTRRLGAGQQGQLQGALASLMGIAGMIGPGMFTQTFAAAIGRGSEWQLPGAPYLLSAGLTAVSLAATVRVVRKK